MFQQIVTAYYFILYILFIFQLSYSPFNSSVLTILANSVCIVHVSTLLFALIVTGYYFTVVYIVHVSTLLFALIVTITILLSVYIVHV